MSDYIRNRIDDVISVRSIVTVFRKDLRNAMVTGEAHDFPEIFYVEQEQTNAVINGKQVLMDAGSLMIYAPNSFHGEPFARIPGGIVNIISFETDSHMLEPLYDRPIPLTPRQREQFETLVSRGLALFKTVKGTPGVRGTSVSETADMRELQQLKNLLEVFLLDLSCNLEEENSRPAQANQEQFYRKQMELLTAYLMDHLADNLSIRQMETAMGFSETSLRRMVRRFRGCSPLSYYQELRIREAKRLIEHSGMNMTEISMKLGFSSLHYFSRVFREKTGMSPSEYAKLVVLRESDADAVSPM